ncbi:putative polyamine transporter 4 [Xylogone sp. PMI_703]|nr:putative polyamine transporter 4 [Xylogone sp. PMI_703]
MEKEESNTPDSGSTFTIDDSEKAFGFSGESEIPTLNNSIFAASEKDIEAQSVVETTLDWDSPDDKDDPHNWSTLSRCFHTAVPALHCFILTIGISTYVPGISLIQKQFNVSREVAVLPLSLFTLGFTIGPVIAGPLSELYGRRVVYWTTLPILLICTAIAGSADSIDLLMVARLLAGLGGSGALAVGAGTVPDLWDMHRQGGKAALFFIISPFLGPVLGPLTGAYIIDQYDNNWRYSQWVIMMIAAPITIMTYCMKETSKSRILHLRNIKRGFNVKAQSGGLSVALSKLKTATTRPLIMLTLEPLVACISIYTGFAFAMIFSFLGSYNYVFLSVYNFDSKQIGLTFIGIMIGYFFAIATFGFFDKRIYAKEAAKAAAQGRKPAPEHRLYAAMVGSVLLPIGLFWFAWSPNKSTHWIVPTLAGIPFGWGCLAIVLSATIYLVDVYQAENSASAIAANGILRYGLGAAFPLFTVQMYQRLGIHWAGSVFGFIGLALLPIPWLFFWKGKELRRRSRYNTFKE